MAAAVQKITLSSSRDIPFNKLVLSQSNVRRVKAGLSIEELAEDIARRTLLQSLSVRPILDAEGAETGMFEIPAGGRRYRALELLVKQKRLAKNAPVPCVVRDPATDILAEDDSLAENIQRAPLHPLDQFRAFSGLREKGLAEEEIAAAFFISLNVVKQRLRLASVSSKLLDVYAEDRMSLEQLMTFTVSSDHARQEQVWETISTSWSKEPYQIRRMLTEKTARASDNRAVFIGLDAYEAAGGIVLRDLFQQDDGGWLEDVALLDSLVAAKFKAEAERIADEGWKWIEVAIDLPYGHARDLRPLEGVTADLTAEERATIDTLNAEYQKLEADYEDAEELPEEVDQRLGEIEAALGQLDDRPVTYNPADIARAGVFISIGADGKLSVDRGYERRVRLLRPMERHHASLKMLAESHWRDADRDAFAVGWNREVAQVPEFSDLTIHIVAGLLLPIWKRLPNESTRVYRLQTDEGERIIGRRVSPTWAAGALATDAVTLAPDDAFAALLDGSTVLDLAEGLQLRRVRIMDLHRIELSGFSDTMRDRLRAYGLFHEIISWKLRMFVPTDAHGRSILAKVPERFPIERVSEREAV